MATIPTVNEEKNDPSSHVTKSCLGTPLILRAILQHFSNSELVNLSLVNKQWNFEARSVLRDRATLNAKVSSQSHSTCKYLGSFASDLRQMCVVPFAGIDFAVFHTCTCPSASEEPLDPSCINLILARLPFKSISVDFGVADWEKCRDCPAIALVKRVLKEFAGVLEELSIYSDLKEIQLLQHVVPPNCSFPRLKTLRLEFEDGNHEEYWNFVRTTVSHAPSLRELHMRDLFFVENVLENSSAVLVPSHFHFNPFYHQVTESVVGILRPQRIQFQQRVTDDFDPDILHGLIPRLLQSSRTSLKTLRMDLLFAIPLMCYGICLENVTTLEIRVEAELFQRLQPCTLKLLKGFDLSRFFPKLNKVEIDNDPQRSLSTEQISEFIEQGNAVLKKTLPPHAISIKHLVLRNSVLDSIVPFLTENFRDVKTISVFMTPDSSPVPFTLLWDHFKYLKELEVEHIGDPHTMANLDSVFCGILPEEIAELREKDDEYLKAVEIVPVMPSITCMRDLKKFTFRCTSEADKLKTMNPNLIFSKVTGLIGFARCPNLAAVRFETALKQPSGEDLFPIV